MKKGLNMSSSMRPIAVFGATGAQGGPVVRALLASGQPVRAIARTESHLQSLAALGAEVVAVDLANADALQRALQDVSGAFVHLPFVPIVDIVEAQARAIAEALVGARVPLTVFTASGPIPTSPTGVISFDTKAMTNNLLQTAGIPLITFQPLGYLANLSSPFSAPSIVKANELRYPLPATHRQRWISVEDQAALAIAALKRPDLAGRTFLIGEALTGPEIAEGISEGLGRTIRYVPITPSAFATEHIAPLMGDVLADALVDDYRYLGSDAPAFELAGDTASAPRELGVAYTPVAVWTRTQDWAAAAAMFPV